MMLVDKTGNGMIQIRFRDLSRITVSVVAKLREQVGSYFEDHIQLINLDMSGIHYIDAKGFEALVDLSTKASSQNITLRLCKVSDETWELIDLMQLTQFFQIERVQQGLGEFQPSMS